MPVGAPKGNNNAGKSKDWEAALRVALATYEKGDVRQGQALRKIADKCIEMALEGSLPAIQEIGNRTDGKPVQGIEGSGDGGAIIIKAFALDDRI